MNRRGFLSSLIAVPAAAWIAPNVLTTSAPLVPVSVNLGAAVCAAWESHMGVMSDNIFSTYGLAQLYTENEIIVQ